MTEFPHASGEEFARWNEEMVGRYDIDVTIPFVWCYLSNDPFARLRDNGPDAVVANTILLFRLEGGQTQ